MSVASHDHRPLCAIDAQFSPGGAGGTETLIPLHLKALADAGAERFVVIGRHGAAEELRPLMGPNMALAEYPLAASWYQKGLSARPRGWRGAVQVLARPFRKGPDLDLPADARTAGENDRWLRGLGVRVVHFPYPQHFRTSLPFVYEPWGLPHRHFPDYYPNGEAEWMEQLFAHGCRGAAMIVTGTRWAKQEIMAAYGTPSERIAVLPRRSALAPPSEAGLADLPDDLPERFAFFPSVTWSSKNHLGLLRGLARLRDAHGIKLHLVCTGRTKKPAFPVLQAAIAELGLKKQVRFLGAVPSAAVAELYRRAAFLVHPSKFEGLGLPLVEAFQAGLPVLAARATCIPEVVGDAALLFDPDDPDSIAEALRIAVQQPQVLADLRARGARRLEDYFASDARLAAGFTAVYRRAAGAPLDAAGQALLRDLVSL